MEAVHLQDMLVRGLVAFGMRVPAHGEDGLIFSFTIPGPPRTKKTSNRIVRCGKFPKILPSKAFELWNKEAQTWLATVRAARHTPNTIQVDVNCSARFYRDALRGDAVGYYQALADALQEARIVKNDALIVSWDGSRLFKDAALPRIEVTLTAAAVEPQEAQVATK